MHIRPPLDPQEHAMRAPAWMATANGKALAAAVVLVSAATVGVGVNTYVGLAGTSSSGGTGTISGSTSSAAKTSPNSSSACNGNNCNGVDKSFTVSGNVTGLAPGVARTIGLTIVNNASQAINIRSITVTAADARNSSGAIVCNATNLLLGSANSPSTGSIAPVGVQIPGRGTNASVTFPIKLAAAATDACQNVQWNLTYTGSADQA